MTLTDAEQNELDWDKGHGLMPAVIQHADSGAVLMLGYMDRSALAATLDRGRVVFYSRSKQRLWEKGETSGHTLSLVDIRVDCDRDTLLVSARPAGPVCHTGSATCFGDTPGTSAEPLTFLTELAALIDARAAQRPDGSYTTQLLTAGVKRVAQKVGEEGLEVALAAVAEPDDALLGECADLLYHLLVLLKSRGLSLPQVIGVLQSRHPLAAVRVS